MPALREIHGDVLRRFGTSDLLEVIDMSPLVTEQRENPLPSRNRYLKMPDEQVYVLQSQATKEAHRQPNQNRTSGKSQADCWVYRPAQVLRSELCKDAQSCDAKRDASWAEQENRCGVHSAGERGNQACVSQDGSVDAGPTDAFPEIPLIRRCSVVGHGSPALAAHTPDGAKL